MSASKKKFQSLAAIIMTIAPFAFATIAESHATTRLLHAQRCRASDMAGPANAQIVIEYAAAGMSGTPLDCREAPLELSCRSAPAMGAACSLEKPTAVSTRGQRIISSVKVYFAVRSDGKCYAQDGLKARASLEGAVCSKAQQSLYKKRARAEQNPRANGGSSPKELPSFPAKAIPLDAGFSVTSGS